jgi:phage portal protein BeeE
MCNVLGFDSSIFNDPANKTFNNRKEAERAMLSDAIIPLNEQLSTGYTRWLVPTHFPNEKDNIRMRVDFSEHPAMQEGLTEKADAVTKIKTAGIISANQAAEILDLPPSTDENADKLIISSSNVLLEDLDKETGE